MTILQLLAATAATVSSLSMAPAQAQTPPADKTVNMTAKAAVSTPYSDAYVPRSMRQPKRDAAPAAAAVATSGAAPILLRLQPMQNLKKRFNDADLDNSGTLNREEARQAGLSVVDKNFDNIDTAQRGHVTIDDLNAYLIRRREEANSR